MTRVSGWTLLTFLAFSSVVMPSALAQNYPAKPIRLIVPLAPGGPSDILARMHEEIVKAMSSSEIRKRLKTEGSEVVASTPEQFATIIRREMKKWTKVIKEAGTRVE